METPQGLTREATSFAFREVFIKWERLRVPYNLALVVILAVVVLTGGFGSKFLDPLFWLYLVSRCVGANLLFTAGPALEAYASWLGFRHQAVTWGLFVAGLLLSLPLTVVSVVFYRGAGY